MPVENLAAFNKAVEGFSTRVLERDLVAFHTRVHLDLLKRITLYMRVKTGYARRNWQSTVGVTNETTVGDPKQTVSAAEADAETKALAVSALSGLPPFSVSHIFNNTNYISYLEEGTPKMAADKMVALSVEESKQQFV